jgi:hypothetical protein
VSRRRAGPQRPRIRIAAVVLPWLAALACDGTDGAAASARPAERAVAGDPASVQPVAVAASTELVQALLRAELSAPDRARLRACLVAGDEQAGSLAAPDAAALLALPGRVRALLDQCLRVVADGSSHAEFPSAVRHAGRECVELLRLGREAALAECARLREHDYRELSERKAKLDAGVGKADGKDADMLRALIRRTQDQLAAIEDRAELLDRQAQVLAETGKQVLGFLDTGVRQDAFRPGNAVDCELLRDALTGLLDTRIAGR